MLKKSKLLIVSWAVQYKTWKVATSHTFTSLQMKDILGWCFLVVWRSKFSRCQKLTVDFEEKNFALW